MENKKLVEKYILAWEKQDINLILEIFDNECEYVEYPFEKNKIYFGLEEVKKYWYEKVCVEQENIKVEIKKIYECENTIICEWEANFFSKFEMKKIKLIQVGIFEIENKKIKKFREYWHSFRS